jgi:hypothetical protein
MYVIASGVLEMSTTMDNNENFILERSIRGTVINAHSMIYENKCKVIGKASDEHNLSFFCIDKMRLMRIIKKDAYLMTKLRH